MAFCAVLAFVIALCHLASAQSTPVTQLAEAVDGFSQTLYKKVNTNGGNVVFSPYSIHSALSMTSLGARGTTLNEMIASLGTSAISQSHVAYKDANSLLTSQNDVRMEVANGLFLNPSVSIKPQFTQEAQDYYSAKVANLDPLSPGGSEKIINDFVSENTNGVIKDVATPGSIPPDTLTVLVNTLFFNGTWKDKFLKRLTKKENFYKDSNTIQVNMMNIGEPIAVDIGHHSFADVIDLPFKGSRFVMRIVKPLSGLDMSRIESNYLNRLDELTSLSVTRAYGVVVKMPKFKIESTLELNPHLKSMGFARAFDPTLADFTGISDIPAYISKVVHKALIDVQESGTVAAAATVISIRPISVPITMERFTVDRPFFFFLMDKTTNMVLFHGKYNGD